MKKGSTWADGPGSAPLAGGAKAPRCGVWRWLARLTNRKVHSRPGAEGAGGGCEVGRGQLAEDLADCGKEDFRFSPEKD